MARKKKNVMKFMVEFDENGDLTRSLWYNMMKSLREGDMLVPTSAVDWDYNDNDEDVVLVYDSKVNEFHEIKEGQCCIVSKDKHGRLHVIMPSGVPMTIASFRDAFETEGYWGNTLPFMFRREEE